MKYIKFKEIPFEGKTKRFEIISIKSNDLLGKICYDTGWRQYVFLPCFPTKWSIDCLDDINEMLFNLQKKDNFMVLDAL